MSITLWVKVFPVLSNLLFTLILRLLPSFHVRVLPPKLNHDRSGDVGLAHVYHEHNPKAAWGMAVFVRSKGEEETYIKYATGGLKGEAIRFVETGGVFRGIDGCYSWFNSSAKLALDLSNGESWTLSCSGPSAAQRGRGIDLPSDRRWTVKLEPSEEQYKRRFSVSLQSTPRSRVFIFLTRYLLLLVDKSRCETIFREVLFPL